jgi:hypothetical protein
MRPMFSYYGAKYTGAKHYGPPRRDLVIEPFAGSAAYSVRWCPPRVKLYDVSPDICDLWDFLIHSSERDIESIPDQIESDLQLHALPRGQRLLCSFWVAKGRAEPSSKLSPWYFQYRNARDCRVWGPKVKARILAQKPYITRWEIDCLSWDRVPLEDAHWFIDPPYNNGPGRRYPYPRQGIDYLALGDWCRALPGAVDVCENVGAEWLPFSPLYEVVSSRGRRDGTVSQEALWRKS